MQCKVDGCGRDAHYKAAVLCQKHYFRQWRYGTTEKVRVAKPVISNPAGYLLVHRPDHPLAQRNGYVYAHRAVLFDAIGPGLMQCELCGRPLDWKTVRVDHIDCDVKNNCRSNLRPTCNRCNTHRGIGPAVTWKRTHKIEFDGLTLTPTEWSRDPRVQLSGRQIIARLRSGMMPEQALFAPKRTHNGNDPTKAHYRAKARELKKERG